MSSIFPHHWPVRWRIAAVSAALTFLILLVFALLVGRLATSRIKADFHDELVNVASQMSLNIQVGREPGQGIVLRGADLEQMALAGEAAVRIVDAAGNPFEGTNGLTETPDAPALGPPRSGVTEVGDFDVAAQRMANNLLTGEPVYLQYARTREDVDETVDRLWLLLAGGVAGGTVLAMIAGIAVAGRAMRPVSALTSAAREVAATRDPSRRIPTPVADDEVGELARTLGEMLRELDAARSENEQMVQAQREFVADASHELRTPLTSILANLELLQARLEGRGEDGEDAEIVAGALASSMRMRRLVSDLLLLARADAGRSGTRGACDLAEIATSAIDELRAVSGSHSIELVAAEPVTASVNRDDVHRLILNLVENAVHHTPPGSAVRVFVGRDGEDAVIEVADDGPGLPEGLGEQIFARFVRGAGPADLNSGSGTGLGLAIVKAVVVAHGGRVDFGTSDAGGARFTIRLPAQLEVRTGEPVGVS